MAGQIDHDSVKAGGVAVLFGLALWAATAYFGGRQEPWDSPLYWSASYPLALTASGLLGFWAPRQPWRWAALLIFSQILVLAASASDISLLPLGLIVLACLALPAIGLAQVGARLREWSAR